MTNYEKFIYDTLSEIGDFPCDHCNPDNDVMMFMAEHCGEWCEDNCDRCDSAECWKKFLETKYKLSQRNGKQIKIKYHNPDLTKIEKIANGDWIDLRAAEDVSLKAGEFRLISLGVSMKLPDGYEAHIVPRSSTFKTWNIIQTNHMGVIDNSYSGDNDVWMFPALALRDTEIKENDRICQFRIVEKQPSVEFAEVEKLGGEDRGGFGSTGTN